MASDGGLGDAILVSDLGTTLTSRSDGSSEEFDVLVLLNDRLLVCEPKCQKRPASAVERRNYQNTLHQAALQAGRKATWLEGNLDVLALELGIEPARLSRGVFPLVIANHPFGVGLARAGVSVIDLTLFKWYLARPYLEVGMLDPKRGLQVARSEPVYSSRDEMAERFPDFVESPLPLQQYIHNLQPTLTRLPLRAQGKVYLLNLIGNDAPISGSGEHG